MADLRVEHEQETQSGWQFAIRIGAKDDPRPLRIVLTLSWADYDHWSSGTEPPSATALQVLTFALNHRTPAELPARFDAATVRRWMPQIDDALGRGR